MSHQMMRALEIDSYGGNIHLVEKPVPRPERGEVLVRMAASPMGPGDILFMRGEYGYRKPLPVVPGLEGSGTVVSAGTGLRPRFLLGRRVACASSKNRDGAWAEYMVTKAAQCVPLLGSVGLEQGASMLVDPLCAWGLMSLARRGKHEAIANTAAAGSLGQMVLRLGVRFGYPVVHLVHRQSQVDLLREMGASHVLNSSDPEFDKQMRETFHTLNVTLALDAIAGDMTGRLVAAMPRGGSVTIYGGLSGTDVFTSGLPLVFGGKSIHGFYVLDWLLGLSPLRQLMTALTIQRLLATDLRTKLRARVPLEEGKDALEAYAAKMTPGKFLIVHS